jgi:hypothetical protein
MRNAFIALLELPREDLHDAASHELKNDRESVR